MVLNTIFFYQSKTIFDILSARSPECYTFLITKKLLAGQINADIKIIECANCTNGAQSNVRMICKTKEPRGVSPRCKSWSTLPTIRPFVSTTILHRFHTKNQCDTDMFQPLTNVYKLLNLVDISVRTCKTLRNTYRLP
jgi:hypothetical protein